MGRSKARMCVRGHDTWETGRYPSGYCRACHTTGNKSGRPLKRFCKRGHDTEVTGRYRGHECAECKRIRARDWQQIQADTDPSEREAARERLNWTPLESALLAHGYVLYQVTNATSLKNWREQGIPPVTADAVCIRLLGKHPAEIYGFDVWLGMEEAAV